jgi:N-glycosidase YbiA
MAEGVIDEFKGDYAFLSNFYSSPVSYKGIMCDTLEHAFQCAKTTNQQDHDWIHDQPTPARAKKAGSKRGIKVHNHYRRVALREDWDSVRLDIMLNLLRLKFSLPDLREKLLRTGDGVLVEGNWWGDTFWGVCDGEGENHLGLLLMQVRREIRSFAT